MSSKPGLARAWLVKVQEALGSPIGLTVGEKSDEFALLLEVDTAEGVDFKPVPIFDVLLQSKSADKPL